MFPVIIIAAGVTLVLVEIKKHRDKNSPAGQAGLNETAQSFSQKKELRRSISDKKIFGVCGGVATYFGIDSTLVRILYLVLVFASFGLCLLLYIILALLMPEEQLTTS